MEYIDDIKKALTDKLFGREINLFEDEAHELLHEVADEEIPIYYNEVFDAFIDHGDQGQSPEGEEFKDVIRMMQSILYGIYYEVAAAALEELREEEKNNRGDE